MNVILFLLHFPLTFTHSQLFFSFIGPFLLFSSSPDANLVLNLSRRVGKFAFVQFTHIKLLIKYTRIRPLNSVLM